MHAQNLSYEGRIRERVKHLLTPEDRVDDASQYRSGLEVGVIKYGAEALDEVIREMKREGKWSYDAEEQALENMLPTLEVLLKHAVSELEARKVETDSIVRSVVNPSLGSQKGNTGCLLQMLLLVVLGLFVVSLFGCSGGSPTGDPKGTISKEIETPASNQPVSRGLAVRLSKEAQEVSDLLDNGKYSLADILLNRYIAENPKDAGLYCQYLRYLLKFDILMDTTLETSPVFFNDAHNLFLPDAAKRTIALAIEADSETRPWIADTVFREIYSQMLSKLNDKDKIGYIQSRPSEIFNLTFAAIEIDPAVAKTWAPKYESLIGTYVKTGKALSAMWTANLVGDMESGARGDHDFLNATSILREVIQANTSTPETEHGALTLYASVFGEDAKRLKDSSEYTALVLSISNAADRDNDLRDRLLPSSLYAGGNSLGLPVLNIEKKCKITGLTDRQRVGVYGRHYDNEPEFVLKNGDVAVELGTASRQVEIPGSGSPFYIPGRTESIEFLEIRINGAHQTGFVLAKEYPCK